MLIESYKPYNLNYTVFLLLLGFYLHSLKELGGVLSVKRGIFLIVIALMLTGCGQSFEAYEYKKSEVEDYNKLVDETLKEYSKSKAFAETQQEELKEFIFTNKYFPTIVNADLSIPSLTEEEMELFEYKSILYNDYYTSVGSSTVRQIFFIKGKGDYVMSVKVLWSEDGIVDFQRKVFEL